MTYRFKPAAELGWGVAIAAGLVILQALVTLDPETVTDWRTWAIALGGAAIRAAAGAAIDYLRRSAQPEPTLVDRILALSPAEREALTDELERHARQPLPPTPPRQTDPRLSNPEPRV